MNINREFISKVYMCDKETMLYTATTMIYFTEELWGDEMFDNPPPRYHDYRFYISIVRCLLEELRDRLAQETDGQAIALKCD